MSTAPGPWQPADGPARRKVAWGGHEDAEKGPAHRAGASSRAAFGEFTLEVPDEAQPSDLARMHAGALSAELPAAPAAGQPPSTGLESIFDLGPDDEPKPVLFPTREEAWPVAASVENDPAQGGTGWAVNDALESSAQPQAGPSTEDRSDSMNLADVFADESAAAEGVPGVEPHRDAEVADAGSFGLGPVPAQPGAEASAPTSTSEPESVEPELVQSEPEQPELEQTPPEQTQPQEAVVVPDAVAGADFGPDILSHFGAPPGAVETSEQEPNLTSVFGPDDSPDDGTGEPTAANLPPAPTHSGGRARPRLDLAARRAAVEAAKDTSPGQVKFTIQQQSDEMRYTDQDKYYSTVDRILGVGQSGDPALQAMVRKLELTRDKALDRAQRRNYQDIVEPLLAKQNIQIGSPSDRTPIFDMAYDEMLGIGPLGPLWRDDSISEIMVSGPYKVTVERDGRLGTTPVRFRNQDHLERTARTLAAMSADDRSISATNPLVTLQLPRARVQFVWRPLAVAKVAIAIRKFGDLMGLDQLLSYGSLSDEMSDFLRDAVAARATLLVSGGTGSGKTTFINAVSEFIPETERVITIEDALELQLRNTHVESFITKEAASADDTMLFGQEQLLKASLRMRPDRIIVGEIRDGRGCSVMLEAANTGHDGTMTTIHANSAELALHRMASLLRRAETMPDDVARTEVASAIDIVVQVVRTRGRRFVSEISLVDSTGSEPVRKMFVGEFPAGAQAPVFRREGRIGTDTDLARKMIDAGIDPEPWR